MRPKWNQCSQHFSFLFNCGLENSIVMQFTISSLFSFLIFTYIPSNTFTCFILYDLYVLFTDNILILIYIHLHVVLFSGHALPLRCFNLGAQQC